MTTKKVKFHFARDVWIIPNKEDIICAGLKEELWWSEQETIEIKNTAFREFDKICMFNQCGSRRALFRTMWYDLDFDKIYELMETFKLTRKIELKKLCDLYTIKTK
jgi:hypothetical protein